MPCKVKNNPNTDTETPINHLLILLKNALNLLIFSSFVRFDAIEKAIIVTVSGKTTVEITETIVVEKKDTAGRHTETENVPPLADISVSIIGYTISICRCIDCTLPIVAVKHSVKMLKSGINAAT